MRTYSPPYHSPPRKGHGARGRSPPRRGYGGRKDQNNGSLLVRNIPLNCRPEDLRAPFERYGPVRDVYLPKDYYTGEPRGFAFVQFVDPLDASEAQYGMNGRQFAGREITVVVAADTRKRPEEMRHRGRPRGPSGYGDRRSYGRRYSRSVSRSRSPRYRHRERSRSYSPAPRRRRDHSVSPPRRQSGRPRSPRDHPKGRDGDDKRRSHSPSHSDHPKGRYGDDKRRSHSPSHSDPKRHKADNGHKKSLHDSEESGGSRPRQKSKSPRSPSGSPRRSRSRSVDSGK